MQIKLAVVGGDLSEKEYQVSLPAVIGRSKSADLSLDQNLVSRRHCELYQKSGRLLVRDLGSTNGTFVGDTRLEGDMLTELQPGSLLTLGTVTFRAVYSDVSASATPVPPKSRSINVLDDSTDRVGSASSEFASTMRIETERSAAKEFSHEPSGIGDTSRSLESTVAEFDGPEFLLDQTEDLIEQARRKTVPMGEPPERAAS